MKLDENVLNKVREFISSADNILVLCHLDADGLSSGGLVCNYLLKHDKGFTARVVKQFEKPVMKQVIGSSSDLVIIVDMGSGQPSLVKEILDEDKKVIIMDHHQIVGSVKDENLVHVNLEEEQKSISGSGTVFKVLSGIDKSFEQYAYLALLGAMGDNQLNKVSGSNREILDECINKKIITPKKGLNLFGRVSRPLHEAIANSDFVIPGITSNETGAVQFLSRLGIDLKKENGDWVTLDSLSKQDYDKLISNIIILRNNNGLDNNIFKEHYLVGGRKGVLGDLLEWSTLLNACGRVGRGDVGLLTIIGFEEKGLFEAEQITSEYKSMLAKGLSWVQNNKDSDKIMIEGDMVFMIARSEVPDSIIGTVCSIIVSGKEFFKDANLIVGFAERSGEDSVKVSLRSKKDSSVNLGKLVSRVCEGSEWQGGGHGFAAGAVIRKGDEEKFIDRMKKLLGGLE